MIAINGMEMPEDCNNCRFKYDMLCHAAMQSFYEHKTMKNGKLKDCPLIEATVELFQEQEEPVRCKDCKHRGVGNNDFPIDIEWPDEECPYECSDDPFYNWLSPDNWYCANGERKDTEV